MMRPLILFALVNNVFSWNPTSYPFLPASADSTKVRNLIIEAQGPGKRILDIGCGLGYSTSEAAGCLGIDRNKYTVQKAQKLFPEKKFRHSFRCRTGKTFCETGRKPDLDGNGFIS